MVIYSGFSHWKWWFSIAMLVYQRVGDPSPYGLRLYLHCWWCEPHSCWSYEFKEGNLHFLLWFKSCFFFWFIFFGCITQYFSIFLLIQVNVSYLLCLVTHSNRESNLGSKFFIGQLPLPSSPMSHPVPSSPIQLVNGKRLHNELERSTILKPGKSTN